VISRNSRPVIGYNFQRGAGLVDEGHVVCWWCTDDVFLPSDESNRSESDDFDREIEEFKRLVSGSVCVLVNILLLLRHLLSSICFKPVCVLFST